MKTSNKFTLVRIFAAPIFFILYFLPLWLKCENGSIVSIISICVLIPFLALAEITDYFDGHFARKHNEVSDFGKMFDPFADVFLHLSTFTCFVFTGWMHPALYILILYREFSQNFLRMVAAKKGTAIAARKGGKLKTVFYITSCFVTLVAEGLVRTTLIKFVPVPDNILHLVPQIFFAVCVILSYASFIDYLKNFGSVLKEAAE
ncbi:MAG: CDP-diacylglycerol--glycerol-3-phosphate 3-phosphatidyltransferase [Treponema sp.]|nr:CDP-diacylglycerol--glycerol-3-phosphate 3-phosphatidyltransferase [Treponema sp.]